MKVVAERYADAGPLAYLSGGTLNPAALEQGTQVAQEYGAPFAPRVPCSRPRTVTSQDHEDLYDDIMNMKSPQTSSRSWGK